MAPAQMVTGAKIPGYDATMGTTKDAPAAYRATFLGASAPGNILWPGEQAAFTIQILNPGQETLAATGQLEVIHYATRGRPGNIWTPDMFRLDMVGAVPVSLALPAGGWTNLVIRPMLPEIKGAYALVLDLGKAGRQFVTSCVRTFRAENSAVQYPQFCMDTGDINVLTRLGAAPNRVGISYKPSTDPDFETWYQKSVARLRAYQTARLSVTVEIGGGDFWHANQPLGRPRTHLDEQGVMRDTKFDLAWLPSYDADFRLFTKRLVAEFGWPRGPINGIKLWNEPWEGMSISGWGADLLRYREIFRALCEATREACAEAGVEVLTGGCDSSSNTFDKLFSDGSDEWLQYLDFCSIHYQGMQPPATVKAWVDRKGPRGRVRIWDTESWVANTDDRVAAVIAVNLSTGHDRAVGIYGGNVASGEGAGVVYRNEAGQTARTNAVMTWSVAAAVGAATHFIGERRFEQLLFTNGLPWVLVFRGRPDGVGQPDPEDGTVVVIGDIGDAFGHDDLLFRTARGLKENQHKDALRAELADLPADAPGPRRAELLKLLRTPETLQGATMTLVTDGATFGLYDFYGNPVPAAGGKIVVPLDHRGFFLRGGGRPGDFAALQAALRASRVDGIEPLATVCHDMTRPIEPGAELRLSLNNVLNRPVRGRLSVTMGGLTLDPSEQELVFGPHETRVVTVAVVGKPAPDNRYPLLLVFDAGADGRAVHEETMSVNLIARRSIAVDGKLDDWAGALPQSIVAPGSTGPTLTEAAWLPFKAFEAGVTQGLATAFLAYDTNAFYFAAKITDTTPDEGMPRYETFDPEPYFYPQTSTVVRPPKAGIAPFRASDTETPQTLVWPEGVRRYSYRRNPVLPCGNSPNHDNVQLAFNVLSVDQKPWYACPPGTMPGYIGYKDTDYEYALNPVASHYGGGTEIWRLQVPGMPHKHFYPRQPKSPLDGPVKAGQLAIRYEGNTRIVEASIPWSELPDVKKRVDAGQSIKFSYRVNDNAGRGTMELSRERSVAKRNISFTADWVEHWANELDFGWER
jgi:hypothetical protein